MLAKDKSKLIKLLVPLAATPLLLATALVTNPTRSLAQTPTQPNTFSLPASLPSDTTVRVGGSSSMTVINEALKGRFQEKFPGAVVNLEADGTDAALQALLQGDVDLVAVGRPLTDQEKAQGLVEVPVSREKIAIIVGPGNPLANSLTFEQFARMFRGEITDWSQVGGAPGAIRFVDRPDFSDTRQALSNYTVFKAAPFKTGANATQVDKDDTVLVVKELGNDGISYGIASQVLNQNNVKVVPMHDTLPDDPRYPFSQPRGYVYKGTPSPGVQAFLGFATSAPGQEAIQAAKQQEAAAVSQPEPASPSPAVVVPGVSPESVVPGISPESVAPTAIPAPEPAAPAYKNVPWWPWWLALPLLGGLLWWLLRDRGGVAASATSATPVAPIAPVAGSRSQDNRLILTPRNCRDAYAYWEIPEENLKALQQQGGQKLMLRLYDVTDIDMDRQPPHTVKQFDCNQKEQDLHVPIAVDNRDYVAELGYVTSEGQWLKLIRSDAVRVPACGPLQSPDVSPASREAAIGSGISSRVTNGALAGSTATAVAATAAAQSLLGRDRVAPATVPLGQTQIQLDSNDRIILVPRNSHQAYAYWEVSEEHKAALRRQGGQKLMLRIYDATDLDIDYQAARSVQEYECDEQAQDQHVSIPVSDRDYVADLGYVTNDSRWLSLARSLHVRVPTDSAIL